MSFFYDLNKKLDSIRATPEVTHQQLNERDMGKHNNATTGFAALAKKTNPRIAGSQLKHMREKGQVEEGGWKPMDEPVAKSSASKSSSSKQPDPNVPGSGIIVGPDKGPPPKKTDDRLYKDSVPVDEPVKKTANEAAKYRDPKYKDKLYTQEPLDHTFGPDMDAAYYNDYPDDYAGRKQPMGSGSGDPLRKGFGRGGASNSINTHGKRKGLPSRDQITSLKGSIKDAHGTHAEPNLPEAGVPMTAKQKSFAKLAPPADKITFADKIAGAKKEVDEMLGNVAADAMKKAVGGGRGRNAEMGEASDWSQLHKPFNAGHFDDTPTSRKSNTSGRVDTSKTGSTVHYAGKNYSGAGHDAGAETGSAGSDGPRGRGRPKGSKAAIGAKINRGTSKLMTRESDADQGEYDQEGKMGRNEIHTMMRNAKQLEKMLGNDDNLPEWVQKKLSLASDYMQTIADYLASEKETGAEDQTGREVEVELAEKKAKPTKKNDGNLANNAKPYDKVTRGDVVAGRLGKDEMGGKSKPSKAPAKKEKEVEESTTAGSVATATASGKAGGDYGFGGGVYESINRAVETQINESMNISMNMSNDEHGGPGQTLTITATDEDATQLAQLLKMAGMGNGSGESCGTCGMADCGCGDMEQMEETYGDNVTDMNSPDYPTNTELGSLKTALTGGGLNKPKRDVAGNGQTTVPVTAVREHDSDFLESIQRMREIAGIKSVSEDKAEWLKPESMPGDEPTAPGGVEKKKEGDVWVYKPKNKDERLTTTIPSKYTDPDKKKNESIFTDTANLWKSYKG